MTQTIESIKNFPQLVNSHATQDHENANTILAQLKKVLAASPQSNFNQKQLKQFFTKRAEVVDHLVDQYFVAHFCKEFPLIDDALFKMRRYFLLRAGTIISDTTKPVELFEEPKLNSKGKPSKPKKIRATKIEVPLFAYVPLPATDQTITLANYSKTVRRSWRRTTTKVNMSTKLPGEFGVELQNIYAESVAKVYQILADCYAELGKIQIQGAINFEIGAIWIPTINSINVKSEVKVERLVLDPAMVLKVRDKAFLITLWEVEEEKPIEHYIREFTTGSLKGRKVGKM